MKALRFTTLNVLHFPDVQLPHTLPDVLLYLAAAFLAVLLIYLVVRLLFQALRLTAVLGLTLLVAAAVWLGMSVLEHSLGPDWEPLFFYRPLPFLDITTSWTKLAVTAFITLLYLWYLLRPVPRS